MDHKPHKPKAKTMDVAAPRPAHASASAASLVIPTRAVIKDESNGDAPDTETATPASQPKRRTIVPVDANTTDAAEPAVNSQSTEQESSPEAAQPSRQPTPPKPTEELADEHPTDKTPADAPAPAAASDTNVTKQPTQPTDQPDPSTNAAAPAGTAQAKNAKPDEISKAVERERQLQEYINNRKYFVPIRAAARERSIKRSLFLTLLVLVLAVVLVDLMLDTGIILLIQKIPHTHFFNLGG